MNPLTSADLVAAWRPDEDDLSGFAPVEEVRLSMEVRLGGEPVDSAPIVLEGLPGIDPSSRLGRIPCEALFWLLSGVVDPQWWRLEPEAIFAELLEKGYALDSAGGQRVLALWSILKAPEHACPFYTEPLAFLFLCCSLLGRPVRFSEDSQPTPLEVAVAVDVVQELRPLPFSEDVRRTIAAVCLSDGLWCLPAPLTFVQDVVQEILAWDDTPLSEQDVQQVHARVAKHYPNVDDAPSPDEVGLGEREEILRVQVIKVLDLLRRLEDLTRRADHLKDLVLKRFPSDLSPAAEKSA